MWPADDLSSDLWRVLVVVVVAFLATPTRALQELYRSSKGVLQELYRSHTGARSESEAENNLTLGIDFKIMFLDQHVVRFLNQISGLLVVALLAVVVA